MCWFLVRKYPNNGRAYFTNAETLALGGGIELWRGFFQSVPMFALPNKSLQFLRLRRSVRPTLGRMLVNVDTAMAAM
jgi:eukaryotic translation initiation factor 2C